MDFATAPCILDAVSQRLAHGVFGYSRWQNEAFLGAIAHWYASRFHSVIDPQTVVYGPSVIYMVAETIRQWSQEGDGVVVHTPAYDAFYNTITANRRQIAPVPLTLTKINGTAIWRAWKRRWRSRRIPCCCSAARTTQRGKSGAARSSRPWRRCAKSMASG
jgi:bifunctional pyridoxal-dependent enzyme with beta-cystathionase and maltose regulon repressor activities